MMNFEELKDSLTVKVVNTENNKDYLADKPTEQIEDMSVVFMLFNEAKSFIFLNIFGILRLISKNTTTHKLSKKQKFISNINFLGILFDF